MPAGITSTNLPKARATKACTSCRARKTRCDVGQKGSPCTSCQAHGFDCALVARKRRQSRKTGGRSFCADKRALKSLPEHVVLHQVPHFSFLRQFIPDIYLAPPRGESQQRVNFPVPMHDSPPYCQNSLSDISAEETSLLRKAGVFNLPEKNFRDTCIAAYFQYFHSFFPIIDRESFLTDYHTSLDDDPPNRHQISLLLLYAIISTACTYLPISAIQQAGYEQHKEARSIFHMRARLLHGMNWERDDMATVQALLLMSQYYPSADEQRHTWFWAYQAIALAQGLGMHRAVRNGPHKKLWARIWWGCVVRDRLIALGTGRPMHINILDCSVPIPGRSDLQETDDNEEQCRIKDAYIDFLRLCRCAEGVLTLSTAAGSQQPDQIELCERMLQHWVSNLNTPEESAGSFHSISRDRPIASLYQLLLRLTFNTILILLDEQRSSQRNGLPEGYNTPSMKTRIVAADSVRLLQMLLEFDLIKYLPTQSVTFIIPPLIVQTSLMWEAENRSIYENAELGFHCCMDCLSGLSGSFWHAGFYHALFEIASQKASARFHNGDGNDHLRQASDEVVAHGEQEGENCLTRNTFHRASTYHGPLTILASNLLPSSEILRER